MSSSDPPGEPERPTAEELLDRFNLHDAPPAPADSDEADQLADHGHRVRRGRLRIYLGMAPGVGKTYAMLNEGRRRTSRGTDVVVGFVETYGRPLTQAQIGDLEIIPRKRVPYRGTSLEEMDVDAIIARHPQVALVDELAHSNVPGSRNEKRYQDVEELLASGITVITTLNIQHLEGLNDIIQAFTGVRQRETVPDRVLDDADEVELIDIAPDALRSRLRHGNVYPPDRAERALQHYFSQSNLTALRELALRRTAEKTESQLEVLMEGHEGVSESAWATTATERVMVAFDAQPHATELLRHGWRLARGLKAPLLAVTVVCPRRFFAHSPSSERVEQALADLLQLAEDLGAEVTRLDGCDIAAELARVARERHITQIVLGQPTHGHWHEVFFGSVVNRLLREPLGADIHVVPRGQRRDGRGDAG